MSAPDPRSTLEAVRLVRMVYPDAVLHQNSVHRHPALPLFSILSSPFGSAMLPLAFGDTPKDAWWSATPVALAKALYLANRS